MDINVKEIITELVEKISKDKELQALFQKDPIKAVEKLLNVDLPDDLVEKVAEGIKAKLAADKLGDALGALKKFF